MKKGIRIAGNCINKIIRNPRFWLVLVWIFLLDYSYVRNIRNFAITQDLGVTPWLLPFLVNDSGNQLFIILGATMLFCDAPFLNANAHWQIIRSGRSAWFAGNMLYMFVMSWIYTMMVTIIPVFILFPQVGFSWGWGKIIGTLAQTNAAEQIGIVNLDYNITIKYTPVQAMLLTVLAIWLNVLLIAILNYSLNLWTKRGIGAVACVMVGLSPLLIDKLVKGYLGYYLSPPCWMSIGSYNLNGYGRLPSMNYIYIFFAVFIFCGITISYIGIKKKDIIYYEKDEWP